MDDAGTAVAVIEVDSGNDHCHIVVVVCSEIFGVATHLDRYRSLQHGKLQCHDRQICPCHILPKALPIVCIVIIVSATTDTCRHLVL
jgi:hypothetical protein